MPQERESRPRAGFATMMAAIAIPLALSCLEGCSKSAASPGDSGGLAIVLDSDMSIPKDIDHVTLQATQEGHSLLRIDRDVGAGALLIPATFEVKSTGNSAPVSIQAVAYKSGQARVERDAVTPIPEDHVGELRLALNYLCVGTAQSEADGGVGSTCPDGQSCDEGACVPSTVPALSLPTYSPGTAADASVASGCFDVQGCFASATVDPIDMASCSAPLPIGASASTLNVALQLPSGAAGVCGPSACWVVFDEGTDWRVVGSQITLPQGACTSAAAQGATLVVTTACTAKTASVPECGAWSSATTPVSEPTPGMSVLGTSCTGPTSQPCGLCGTETRTCTDGSWSAWSACAGEGVCQPDVTQSCGAGGTQTCGSSCQWGACGCTGDSLTCGAPGTCASPGDLQTCGACGNDCTALANVSSSGIGCAAGKCTYTCASGYADCAGAGAGCTTDLSAPASCGACGHDCTDLPHVSGPVTCSGAACVVPQSSCAPGYDDCNHDPSDGCEASLTQAGACGMCGTVCSGAMPFCSSVGGKYECVPNCSASQTTLCGSSCVNTKSDATNCGACGTACTTAVTHAQAACVASACTFTCNSGYTACGGACVDETSDAKNCGGCGVTCASGVCQASQCTCSGSATQACGNCNTGTQTRSCSAGTWSAWSACAGGGACAPGATASCGANETETCGSSCSWGGCGCSTGFTSCGGACVDTNSNSANCGACGNACASNVTCTKGTCPCAGVASQACGNCNTGTQTRTCDVHGTSSAWSACTGGGTCAPAATQTCDGNGTETCSSTCAWENCACNAGYTMCGSACANLQTDGNNCGRCGAGCAGGMTCQSGTCACPSTATTCGSTCAYVQSDSANCGTCGNACSTGIACLNGACCNPSPYQVLTDSEVYDPGTNLHWQRGANSRSNGTGPATCPSGWRLPTYNELAGILPLNTCAFPLYDATGGGNNSGEINTYLASTSGSCCLGGLGNGQDSVSEIDLFEGLCGGSEPSCPPTVNNNGTAYLQAESYLCVQ